MNRQHFSGILGIGTALVAGLAAMKAGASSFDSAKITRVENSVSVGEIVGGKAGARRAAAVSETVRANNFVQTGSESRAELQFKDTSLVRVGQNSVFSFEAKSRTLSLDKGDMLFYVAPGQGSGTIKTPALTAAITGTLCKVATHTIAVLRGSITIKINGKPVKIPAGYAVTVVKGKLRIYRFDPNEANRGKLYSMGPIPEDPGLQTKLSKPWLFFPSLRDQNAVDLALVNSFVRQPQPQIPQTPQVDRPVVTQTTTPTTNNAATGGNPTTMDPPITGRP